jgi:hypothetical protein
MNDSEWSQPERRRYPRRKTPIQLELRPEGYTAPIHAQTTDICVIGCYVEMSITLEVGSRVSITLWLGDEKLTAEGNIVTRHPQFGNGIELRGMSEDSRHKLAHYLETIV